MKIVTPEQMAEIDRQTMGDFELSPLVLMENAARSVLQHIPQATNILVLIGPGNNGGDGLVLVRALHETGCRVTGLLFSEKRTPQAEEQLRLAKLWEADVRPLYCESDPRLSLQRALESSDLVIDALFGTGLSRPLEGFYRTALDLLDPRKAPILAVDMPSGLDGRTGRPLGEVAIKAWRTVTFGVAKWGQVLYPGRQYVGELMVTHPGFHPRAMGCFPAVEYVDAKRAARLLPQQSPTMHKGTNGRVLLATGSASYPGAGLLSCLGATYGGAGLPTLYAPEELKAPLMSLTPETMFQVRQHPYDLDLEPYRALVLGSGLGPDAAHVVPALLPHFSGPIVLDAEALPHYETIPRSERSRIVLTPHPGELARLLDRSISDLESSRIDSAIDAARTTGCIVCFKGAPTVCAAPDGRTFVNGSGHPVLAQGGSGDVLAGLIGAHLASGLPALEASAGAVYLHGAAAELAAQNEGPRGVPPSRWARYLPRSYRLITESASLDCRESRAESST